MKLVDLLPMCWRESAETVALVNAMQNEIDKLDAAYAAFYNEMYAESADTSIEKWERMCGIASVPALSIGERRAAVLAKLRGGGTCTKQKLRDLALSYDCGDIEVIEDAANYAVKIKFVSLVGIPARLGEFKQAIRDAVPAHLDISYEYKYRRWGEYAHLKWDDLSGYTWREVLTMEVIPE